MNGPRAHIDFETGSDQPLGRQNSVGVHRYAESPHTRIWGFSWRIGEGFVSQWRPGYPDPLELLHHVAGGGIVVAHNAAFERLIWNMVLLPRYAPHWPPISVDQQRCTMAKASALGLPAGLDMLGQVLGTEDQKDTEGSAAMLRLAKPRGVKADGTFIWWADSEPETVDRTMTYCDQDVRTEHAIDLLLPDLSATEQQVWALNQRINDRVIMVDLDYVRRAAVLGDIARKRADAEMRRLTQNAVGKVTEVAKIAAWLNARGVQCKSLGKGDADDLLFLSDVAGDALARQVIELRRGSSKTSTAKFQKTVDCACRDGRLRGLTVYHGARTGREAGRLVQPQNYPRFDHEDTRDVIAVQSLIDTLALPISISEAYDTFSTKHGNVLNWLSKSLRSTFVAAPDHVFLGGDFANIEGRLNAWFGDEAWKLKAFQEYDDGTGPDLYVVTAAQILGKKPERTKLTSHPEFVTNAERQSHGKVPELACIAEGELVLTDKGLVPIEKVTDAHKVWEGTTYVGHGGVVCRGRKKVMFYDNLLATDDHVVFVEGCEEGMPFGRAAQTFRTLKRLKGEETNSTFAKGSVSPREATTFDILNCGPNHRFTVSGRLVHNCGYQGGVGAFITMGANYNVDPFSLANTVIGLTPHEKWDTTAAKYSSATDKNGLQEREWTAIKLIVVGWRQKHPGIVQTWWDAQDAALEAVQTPGTIVNMCDGRIRYLSTGGYLFCCLPSGRAVSYAKPFVKTEKVIRVGKDGDEYERWESKVCFWGVDSVTKQWCVQYLYGGLQVENYVQAAARDVMVEAMLRVEEAGFPLVLTVHDELLAEVEEWYADKERFQELMAVCPSWANGLPLAVKAWEDKRYVK